MKRTIVRRNIGANLFIVLMLGIGIGANAGLFSIAYSALIRPLPFRNPEELVWIDEFSPRQGASRGVSWRLAQALDKGSPLEICLYRTTAGLVGRAGPPLEQAWVTPNVSRVLQPASGSEAADWNGPADGIFFRDPDEMAKLAGGKSVGDSLLVDSESWLVMGTSTWTLGPLASAQAYGLLNDQRVAAQLGQFGAQEDDLEAFHIFNAVGKLKPGVSIEQAELALNQMKRGEDWLIRATPLQEHVVGEAVGQTIRLLQLLVFISLAVACATTASLLLARCQGNRRKTAIRFALGASKGRVRAEILGESIVLSLAAGLLGLLSALALIRLAPSISPTKVFGADQAELNLPVLGFVLLISILSGIAVGLWPALQAGRGDLAPLLVQGATVTAKRRVGAWIVALQTALSTALLVAALATLISLKALTSVETGFEPEECLAMRVSLEVPPKVEEGRFLAFAPDLIRDLESIPGVVSASLADGLPFSEFTNSLPLSPLPPEAARLFGERRRSASYALVSRVTPGYFKAMGIPILKGSPFEWRHTLDAPLVAVVSRSLSRRLFGTENPIGRGFTVGVGYGAWIQVLGVAGDIRQWSPAREPIDQIYVPILQSPFLYLERRSASFEAILRTAGPPLDYSPSIRNRIESGGWKLSVESSRTLAEHLDRPYLVPRFVASIVGFFAFLSVSLTLTGLFGLASREALRREREMAIRTALGGSRVRLAGLFLRETASWLLPGLAVGTTATGLLARGLDHYLYQVSLSDPFLYLLANALLLLVGPAVSIVPMRSWLRTNLTQVLNTD